MCGIAGIFDQSGRDPVALSELDRMLEPIAHRGPDGRGTWSGPGVGLAHRRLAILDLRPESDQPFEIDGGAYWLTFNGEIYNYVELRETLEREHGCRFRTTCDTEVLVRAYQVWGPDAVSRFNGMWAFAIYDRERDELFCSRDRFGIKPFNYVVDRGRVLFGSEIKSILGAAPHLARPDYLALSRVLRGGQGARHERTCFEGIRRLSPAHNMIIRRDGIEIRRYWDYPTDQLDISPEEAQTQLRDLLIDSLRIRMRSDVPVGSTLSAGVDSSTIVSLLRHVTNEPHNTFTAAYPGEPWDEGPRAKSLAESLGMTPNLITVEAPDFIGLLRQVVRHVEMPIDSDAVVPIWRIMELARSKVTVLLEGQGADELLAGYRQSCFAYAAADRLWSGHPLDAWREFSLYGRHDGWKSALMWAGRASAPWAVNGFRRVRGDEAIFAGALREAPAPVIEVRHDPRIPGRLNRLLRYQHEGTLVDLLHYGDAMSMAHSLESRLPFMDYRLVEFGFRLPGRYKFAGGHGKRILKDAVRDDVPAAYLESPGKLGFRTPIDRWFRQDSDVTVGPVLESEACRERGLFDPQGLSRQLDRYRRGEINISKNVFRWVMAELWFQEMIDGRGA